MKELLCNIQNHTEAAQFIERCEQNLQRETAEALEKLFEGNKPRIIALSGPTCSGKTTTAEKLTGRITEAGHRTVLLSIDDFFFDRKDRNVVEDEAPDYDSVNAIDLDYLGKVTSRLLEGHETLLPSYSFLATARVGYNEYYPHPSDIYVYEGIQAVYPEVTRLFGNTYKSIFISVADDVMYKGVCLTKHEIRLLRRLVRDYRFRNASAEFTLHLWEGVRENEEKHIFPNALSCDVYINSFLPYEPFIIAPLAAQLLETVPADSRYRDEADELKHKLEVFDCPHFDDRMIPENSVFREFIG